MNSSDLLANQLKNDPRIQQAKKMIQETAKEYQKKMTHIKPPVPGLEKSYQEMLDSFAELRGGKLYFPYIGSGFGNGALVELLDGSVKYDMISGIGVHYLGHSHPSLLNTMLDASLSDTVMQGHLQQNADALDLSKMLIQASGMDHCFLSSSGAMANENALKIAFQKKTPASRILAFERCFMGRTLALSQISDKPLFREGLPSNLFIDYIPFYHPDHPEESTYRAVQSLKKHLARHPKEHALMCFELVQGEGGVYPGTTEFFLALMHVLKEHDIAVFVDEIQTFGRTSHLFAYQHFKLQDYVDIVSIGKLSHVCATLFRKEFKPKPGLLSQTFTSSTGALQATKVIIQHLLDGRYFGDHGKINEIHHAFATRFLEMENKYPHLIRGPYGIGTMLVFTPFNGEQSRVIRFIQDLFKAGVISFIAGTDPARVRFLVPAGALSAHDINKVMDIVEEVLTKES